MTPEERAEGLHTDIMAGWWECSALAFDPRPLMIRAIREAEAEASVPLRAALLGMVQEFGGRDRRLTNAEAAAFGAACELLREG